MDRFFQPQTENQPMENNWLTNRTIYSKGYVSIDFSMDGAEVNVDAKEKEVCMLPDMQQCRLTGKGM